MRVCLGVRVCGEGGSSRLRTSVQDVVGGGNATRGSLHQLVAALLGAGVRCCRLRAFTPRVQSRHVSPSPTATISCIHRVSMVFRR
jgi:hypothetical protein